MLISCSLRLRLILDKNFAISFKTIDCELVQISTNYACNINKTERGKKGENLTESIRENTRSKINLHEVTDRWTRQKVKTKKVETLVITGQRIFLKVWQKTRFQSAFTWLAITTVHPITGRVNESQVKSAPVGQVKSVSSIDDRRRIFLPSLTCRN